MSNLNNQETQVIAALESEISKGKARLNTAWLEVKDMEKQKAVLEDDTTRILKHIAYLNDESKKLETEVGLKTTTISGLDTQIKDKQTVANQLQQTVSALSTEIESKKAELLEIEKKVLEHNGRVATEAQIIVNKHKEADQKSAVVEAKVKKLSDFLGSL